MPYTREMPRDLFNESKLLKCYGQLSLLIHDGKAPRGLELVHDDEQDPGFVVDQDPSDGSIFCRNLILRRGEHEIAVGTALNSKFPYPMHYSDPENGEENVFYDNGQFTAEFLLYLDTLA